MRERLSDIPEVTKKVSRGTAKKKKKIKVSCYSLQVIKLYSFLAIVKDENKIQTLLGMQNSVGETVLKIVKILLLSLSQDKWKVRKRLPCQHT